MRIAILAFSVSATLSAAAAGAAETKAPSRQPSPGDLGAEARKVIGPPTPEALVAAAKKIPHQATDADVKRATSGLGPPLAVEFSRCKAGSGECAEGPEATATSRVQAWMVEGATEDHGLFVTSCKTEAGWKAGRVRATSHPRAKGAATTTVHDDVDKEFFLKTCWK